MVRGSVEDMPLNRRGNQTIMKLHFIFRTDEPTICSATKLLYNL